MLRDFSGNMNDGYCSDESVWTLNFHLKQDDGLGLTLSML